MLEIPESICLARQLNKSLKGRTIVEVIAMQNPHKFAFTFGDPAEYPQMLIGKTYTNAEMVTSGGRDTEKDLFGITCGYPTKMSKNTVGQPCPVCGTTIEKANYMGGSVYYCQTCQPTQK